VLTSTWKRIFVQVDHVKYKRWIPERGCSHLLEIVDQVKVTIRLVWLEQGGQYAAARLPTAMTTWLGK
jgi:hypothetical protein